MHDSRGASLKVGDRVLIEAEVTELQPQADENFCCCAVKVVTPDHPGEEKVMSPPVFSAMSTKMLTKIGATCILTFACLMLFASSAICQDSLIARLSLVEQNNNMILSTLTAHKAQLDNIQTDVAAIRAELAAIKKASGIKLAPVSNWAGDAEFVATSGSAWAPTASRTMSSSMMYSSSMMGAGACASGSCGAGRAGLFSGKGLFGRRAKGGW